MSEISKINDIKDVQMGLDVIAAFVIALLFFESMAYVLFWRKQSRRKVQQLDKDVGIKKGPAN